MGSAHTDRLEALLRRGKSATEPGVKAALVKVAAEVKSRLQRASAESFDFYLTVAKALSQIRGTAHADLRLSCIFDCCHYFYIGGFTGSALEAARLLEGLAVEVGDRLWVRKARCLMGIVNGDIGNIAEAIEWYVSALDLAQELEDLDGEIIVLTNLGSALQYAGLYREAIPCHQRSAFLAESSTQFKKTLPAALTNLAQCHLYLDEHERGFEIISKALELSEEPDSASGALHRAIREYVYVQLALELGELELARSHCRACERYGNWGETPRSHYVSSIARGLCEIHGGDIQKGLSLLEDCLSSCGELESARVVLLLALVKAYDQAEQPERALCHLATLLHITRAQRQRGIDKLLALPSTASTKRLTAASDYDLLALELREARLRTRVAEREVYATRIELLERLSTTADLKEDASGEHGYRVGRICFLLADLIGWHTEEARTLEAAARLHDLGKIAVPDKIVLTTDALRDAEREFMRDHTVLGAEMLAKSQVPQLRMAQEIALLHHEWWDGNGYPKKLAGKRIPIHARIVALADVFDALTHGRPYAPPWSIDEALEEIRRRRGTQFDPELTDRFLELIARLRAEHSDLDEFLGRAGRNSPFVQARQKIKLLLERERDQEQKPTVSGNRTRH
jgi:putative two-component system response regulator